MESGNPARGTAIRLFHVAVVGQFFHAPLDVAQKEHIESVTC
jgi:hypothetical protein